MKKHNNYLKIHNRSEFWQDYDSFSILNFISDRELEERREQNRFAIRSSDWMCEKDPYGRIAY